MNLESYFLNSTNKHRAMKPIEEDKKGVYLYVACFTDSHKKAEAFMAVTKAVLYDEVAIEMENLGDQAILFTTTIPLSTIREKLMHNKTQYILLDLSMSYDLESVFGFLPQSKIDMIKRITSGEFSKEKPRLKNKLDESIQAENFELSAPLRDLAKSKRNGK